MLKLSGIERFNLELPEKIEALKQGIEIFKIIPHHKEIAEYTAIINSESPDINESNAMCMKKARSIRKYLDNMFRSKHLKTEIGSSRTLLREQCIGDKEGKIWHTVIKAHFILKHPEEFSEHNEKVKVQDDFAYVPEIMADKNGKKPKLKKNFLRVKRIINTGKTEQPLKEERLTQSTPKLPRYNLDDKKILLKQLEDRIALRLEKRILEDLEKRITKKFEMRLDELVETRIKQKNALKRKEISRVHLFT